MSLFIYLSFFRFYNGRILCPYCRLAGSVHLPESSPAFILMGFTDIWQQAKHKILANLQLKEIRTFNGSERALDETLPNRIQWFFATERGQPRAEDIIELRQYARSPWVQMVVSTIIKQLRNTPWVIVPSDEDEDPATYAAEIERITTLLEQPNRNGDEFWDVWGRYMYDVLTIDAGAVIKGRNSAGEVVELFAYDGSTFLFELNQKGIIETVWKYSFSHPSANPEEVPRENLVYGAMNVRSETFPYGWAPLQSCRQEVEVMIQATRWNKEFYQNSAMPNGFIVSDMAQDNHERLKNEWETKFRGKAHKLGFLNNGDLRFENMTNTNRDMEWLKGMEFYLHSIFGSWGLSPQEVGYYENSNRSTSESQERVTVRNAIKPYYMHLEKAISRHVINDVLGNDHLRFKFLIKDEVQEKAEHEQNMQKLMQGVITINEVRRLEGKEDVEWGDQPMTFTQQDRFAEAAGTSARDRDEEEDSDEKTSKLYQQLFNQFKIEKDGRQRYSEVSN